MRRAIEDQSDDEPIDGSGLLGGITAYHLRILCESGWNGGAGYTPEQVGRMTLDQIWFRLCDADLLKKDSSDRTSKKKPLDAVSQLPQSKDGMIKGRAVDGTPIQARIKGKSLARRLMEEAEAKQQASKQRKKRRKK